MHKAISTPLWLLKVSCSKQASFGFMSQSPTGTIQAVALMQTNLSQTQNQHESVQDF